MKFLRVMFLECQQFLIFTCLERLLALISTNLDVTMSLGEANQEKNVREYMYGTHHGQAVLQPSLVVRQHIFQKRQF